MLPALLLGSGLFSCTKSESALREDEICMRVPTTKATGLSEDEIFGAFLTANDYSEGTAWETAWSGEQSYVLDAAFKKFDAFWAGCEIETGNHRPYYYPLQGSLLAMGYSPHKGSSKAAGTILSVTHNSNQQNQTIQDYHSKYTY